MLDVVNKPGLVKAVAQLETSPTVLRFILPVCVPVEDVKLEPVGGVDPNVDEILMSGWLPMLSVKKNVCGLGPPPPKFTESKKSTILPQETEGLTLNENVLAPIADDGIVP